MKLAIFVTCAALAATPVLAADVSDPAPSPSVDSQTAAKDSARQDYYQDKLDAAKAQTKADNAQAEADDAQANATIAEAQADQAAADRDAAQDRAAQDRADARAADNR